MRLDSPFRANGSLLLPKDYVRIGRIVFSMTDQNTTCAVCGLPIKDCICCEACSHVCPRDLGETWCPICFPEPVAGA